MFDSDGQSHEVAGKELLVDAWERAAGISTRELMAPKGTVIFSS